MHLIAKKFYLSEQPSKNKGQFPFLFPRKKFIVIPMDQLLAQIERKSKNAFQLRDLLQNQTIAVLSDVFTHYGGDAAQLPRLKADVVDEVTKQIQNGTGSMELKTRQQSTRKISSSSSSSSLSRKGKGESSKKGGKKKSTKGKKSSKGRSVPAKATADTQPTHVMTTPNTLALMFAMMTPEEKTRLMPWYQV